MNTFVEIPETGMMINLAHVKQIAKKSTGGSEVVFTTKDLNGEFEYLTTSISPRELLLSSRS